MLRFFTNWLLPAIYTSRTVGRDLHILYVLIFCSRSYILRWPQFTVEVRSCFSHLNNISQPQYNLQAGAYNNSQVVFSCTRWPGDFFVLWKISRLVGVIANNHHWEAPEKRTPGCQDAPLDGCSEGLEKAHAGLQGRGQMGAEMKILRWRGHPLRSFLMLLLDLLKMMVLFSQWESLHLGNL